mgnify:CR=1 FL=1
MKVRINHAVELEEIPEKLSEMVTEIKLEIQKAEKEMVNGAEAIAWLQLSSESVLKYRLLAQSLNSVKTIVSEATQSIDDMLSMLDGYVGLLEPKPEPAAPLPVAEPPVHHSFREDPDLQGPDVPDYSKATPDAITEAPS